MPSFGGRKGRVEKNARSPFPKNRKTEKPENPEKADPIPVKLVLGLLWGESACR